MISILDGIVAKVRAAGAKGISILPKEIKKVLKGTPDYRRIQMISLLDSSSGKKPKDETILFWVPGGLPLMLHVEAAVAGALQLRGYKVHAIICNGPYRACMRREVTDNNPVHRWHESCRNCFASTSNILYSMGIPFSPNGDYVERDSKDLMWEKVKSCTYDDLEEYHFQGINIGKNARSAIIRFLKGKEINGHEEVAKEFLFSAMFNALSSEAAIDKFKPSRIFMSHGIYADWGPALKNAVSKGIPVIGWMASYKKASFYFRHVRDDIHISFHNMSDSAWSVTAKKDLNSLQQKRLDYYLSKRYKKNASFDLKKLSAYSGDTEILYSKLNLSKDKPVWGIFTHISWDAVADSAPMAHQSFDKWILETVEEVSKIKDVQWIIKIHPAETWDSTAKGVASLVDSHYPSLPDHVIILLPDINLNPLDFFHFIDGGVTVYGTAGLELALMGKPVIVSGAAHYGGKGFTYDGLDPDSYTQLLRRAKELKPLTIEQRRLANKYAYSYFIQRQIPLPVVNDPKSNWWHFQYDKKDMLLPGKNPFIDFICDSIQDSEDFIMNEKLVQLAESAL